MVLFKMFLRRMLFLKYIKISKVEEVYVVPGAQDWGVFPYVYVSFSVEEECLLQYDPILLCCFDSIAG